METISWKMKNLVWWRFFWRYALLFALLHLLWGQVINSGVLALPSQLYWLTLTFGLWANVLASCLVLLYCLEHKFKRSTLILAIAEYKERAPGKFTMLLAYLWRFLLFAFAIAFTLGGILPLALKLCDQDPLLALKYAKYIGNFAMIPASYLTFLLLFRRARKHRRGFTVRSENAGHLPVSPADLTDTAAITSSSVGLG